MWIFFSKRQMTFSSAGWSSSRNVSIDQKQNMNFQCNWGISKLEYSPFGGVMPSLADNFVNPARLSAGTPYFECVCPTINRGLPSVALEGDRIS